MECESGPAALAYYKQILHPLRRTKRRTTPKNPWIMGGWRLPNLRKKKEEKSLHEGPLKGIGFSVGMQPYKGGMGINFREHYILDAIHPNRSSPS
jgi:hypothetical protein